ncbi:hypothetical protein TNCV_3098131 [Trichonephila clavipes]|nr:hypothetical protein TNCV_3098131 [Trichonephila clavipes]
MYMVPNLHKHVLFLSWLERITILAPKNPKKTISGSLDEAPSQSSIIVGEGRGKEIHYYHSGSFAMREKGGNRLVPRPDYKVDALKLPNQGPRVSGESLQTYVAWCCPDGT